MLANGSIAHQAMSGNLPVTVCNKHGCEVMHATLTNVKYVPTQTINLISTTKLMKDGWKSGNDKNAIWFIKGGAKLTFDIEIETAEGVIFGCYMKRMTNEIIGATAGIQKMTVQQAHDQKNCKLGTCEACSVAKAKQKNVPKESKHEPSGIPNERIFLEIATIKQPNGESKINTQNWRIMVDQCTRLNVSAFFTTKNGMIEPTYV